MTKQKKAESTALQYALHSILTTRYNYNLAKKKFNTEVADLINYNATPNISFKVEEGNIIIRLFVTAVVRETEEQIMEIETFFAYKIHDLKTHLRKVTLDGKDSFDFIDEKNKGLLTVLIGISFSTIRGIVLERNRGTLLEGVFLPIINPSIFIKNIPQENK